MTNPINDLTQEAIQSSSFCNCTWKDVVAIAISIVGIVGSIFAQSMLGLAGFILCGILFLAKKYEHTVRISDLETQIKNTLEEEEKNLSRTENEIEKQVHQVEVNRNAFEERIRQLELDNKTLEGIQKGLKEQTGKLEEANANLDREKEDLARILEGEKANAAQIRADVQAIIAENLSFGNTSGLFAANVQALNGTKQELEKQLAAFSQEFNGDLKTLAQQIQVAKETSKILADSAKERTESLEKALKELQDNVHQRQEIESELEKDIAALDRKTQELKEQKKQMAETANKLDETVRLKQALITTLDAQILAKQKKLQT